MISLYDVGDALTIMVSTMKDGVMCYGKRDVEVSLVEHNLNNDPPFSYLVVDTLDTKTNPVKYTQNALVLAQELVSEIEMAMDSFDGADGTKIISIPNGLYVNKTATAVDTDLVAGNIRAGVNIFGVAGATNVVDTTTGDAVAGDMLKDKKAWVDGVEITGTIMSWPDIVGDDGVLSIVLPDGLYIGRRAAAYDPLLVTGNIRAGTTVFGVAGATNVVDTTTGDVTETSVLAGKKAWAKGVEVVGVLQSRNSFSGADGVITFDVPNGLYTGKTVTATDRFLVASNIKAGATIFGVAGATNVVDTTTGDAAAANILAGKKAWVKGAEVTGTSTAVETASGDAVAADIVLGKKAWVNGVEITGTLVVT